MVLWSARAPGAATPGDARVVQEPAANTPTAGARRRWRQVRQLPLVAKLLIVLIWPFVVLYVLPWESMWASYKGASRPAQFLIAIAAAAVFTAVVIADITAAPNSTDPNTGNPEPAPHDEPEPDS